MFLERGEKVLCKSLVNLAVLYFQSSLLLAGVISVFSLSRAKLKHNRCNGTVCVTRCPSLSNFTQCAGSTAPYVLLYYTQNGCMIHDICQSMLHLT